MIVLRNDAISLSGLDALNPTHLVISPGPGNPTTAGISCDAIKHFAGRIPILGVCLGEQSMFHVYSGRYDTSFTVALDTLEK